MSDGTVEGGLVVVAVIVGLVDKNCTCLEPRPHYIVISLNVLGSPTLCFNRFKRNAISLYELEVVVFISCPVNSGGFCLNFS